MRIFLQRNSFIPVRTSRMKILNISTNSSKSRLDRKRATGAAVLMLFWTAVFVSCGGNASDSSFVRLLDRVSSQNIVVSPMQDLVKKFLSSEERLDDRWRFVPSLSSGQQKVWGASTQNPVMGHPESPERDDIHLYFRDEEIPYGTAVPQSRFSWRWIRTSEAFDLRQQPAFDRRAQGVALKRGQSVRFEKLLPDQEVLLELYIVNSHWESYRPRLEVLLDDVVIEEFTVSRQRWFRFRFTPELGLHEIKVRFPETESYQENQFVLIGRAQMECPSEIVLLSLARSPADQMPGSGYVFRYHRNDVLDEKSQKEDLGHLLHLYYNYRHTSLPEDAGKGENLYSVKQKLLLGDTSHNVLLAPALSVFSIPLKIPSLAQLECGLGFVDLVGRNPSKPVFRFSIKIKTDNQEDLLLQKEAAAGSYGGGVIWEKLDLSAYAGKKVQLAFITENMEVAAASPPGVPYWVNPVVFSPAEEAPANIVLISLDTVRPDYLGCYGYEKDTSPALDALAQDSALFLNCFSTSSWTLPAHVSLLTGQSSRQHQVYYPYERFDSSTLTMADHLRQQGYTTVAFTGGGYLSSQFGFAKGFDRYQELLLHGENAIRWDEAEKLAEMANDWIRKNRGKKFFLFLHTYQPHDPYANLSPQGKSFLENSASWDQVNMEELLQDTGRFQTAFSDAEKRNIKALYEGEVRYTDQMFVKSVLETLKQNGLYSNTLIIVTSDHGEEFFDHESWLHDHSLYNEGIRIPLIIKFPQTRYSGKRLDALTRITDIVPTALEFAGIPRAGLEIDGISLIPIVQKNERSERSVFSHLALRSSQDPPSVVSLIRGNLKIIVHRVIESPYIESRSYKISDYQVELYDLAADPQETKNLAKESAYRTTCMQMVREIHDLIQETEARRTQKETVVMDSTLEERLKALGYIK